VPSFGALKELGFRMETDPADFIKPVEVAPGELELVVRLWKIMVSHSCRVLP
jgi:hypothetical protein